MHSIRFIARKEVYHILRDVRSLMVVLAMPILMTFLYGFAINLDIENVVIAVIDHDQTSESHALTDDFYKSRYFSQPRQAVNADDAKAILRSSQASAILTIRSGFGRALERGESFQLGVTIDGSDAILAAAVQSYSSMVLRQYLTSRLPKGMTPPGIRVTSQIFYNPDMKSAHFFVPGLVAIILLMISALLTSITIAREKETGTLEQLLTAPVKPIEILLGKLLPYVLIALLDGILVLLFARVVFGVPFIGSQVLLLGFGLVYVATALSIGILISSAVKTQQVAMMIALSATMLPSVMLSGFVFALKNMPFALQIISHIIPARYFATMIRAIMLKGAGLEILIVEVLALLGLMVFFLTFAARSFSTKVA